ncbi:hypothetical protein [Mesorhizobium sp.]|uniref:hypothetical protein n=1 Tax=Mesorhizobium sp. TaxID=1871066 RepID=UPI00257C899C|nr:hypothetical protein [Mesorhizobium sp.]
MNPKPGNAKGDRLRREYEADRVYQHVKADNGSADCEIAYHFLVLAGPAVAIIAASQTVTYKFQGTR